MSTTYTVVLSDAEQKALAFVAVSPDDWIQNAVHARCEVAMAEIVKQEIDRKLSVGESISGTKEEIVLAADIKSAAQQNAEAEAARAVEQTPQE